MDRASRPPRRYSVEEARELLPGIRAILLQVAIERRRQSRAAVVAGTAPGGDPATGEVSRDRARELEASRAAVAALLSHLEQLGVQLRDVENGLVDIPTSRDGEPAWFCWRLADPELEFWHTTREGFASRRPL